jgi:hypothetical protein
LRALTCPPCLLTRSTALQLRDALKLRCGAEPTSVEMDGRVLVVKPSVPAAGAPSKVVTTVKGGRVAAFPPSTTLAKAGLGHSCSVMVRFD